MTASASETTPLASELRDLAGTAIALARVFTGGGRLVVAAPGRADHARHVAVEFVHPAIAGARALPAIAVAPDDLDVAVGKGDAVLIIENPARTESTTAPPCALALTVGGSQTALAGAQLVRWYHLLWELVQLGLEHPGITGGVASEGGDSTNFLYPFLDASETDDETLLAALTSSTAAKAAESDRLIAHAAEQNQGALERAATDISDRLRSGGNVYTIGNGGSACDAARLTRLLKAKGVHASCLADDPAVLTALANDLGANMIFSRQVEAVLQPADVLVVFSTSGSSPNLLAALDVSVTAHASVVACAGYDGGPLCQHANVDHRLIVASSSVHRIQESQALLIDLLCQGVKS